MRRPAQVTAARGARGARGAQVLAAAALGVLGCGAAPASAPGPASWLEEELGDRHEAATGAEPSPEPSQASPDAASGGEPAPGQALGPARRTSPGPDRALAAVRVALRELGRPGAGPAQEATLARALAQVPATSIGALEQLAVARATEPGGAQLALHLARFWLHARAQDLAAPHLARAEAALAGSSPSAALAAQLAELRAASRQAAGRARSVAVLLPMSGRFSAIGQELWRAVKLVPGVQWQVLDTRGEPAQAADMVDRAVQDGAVAILGPVGDREALAAARRAAARGIAIALLAPGEGATPELGVFRLAWSAEDEARAVAQWAAANDFRSVAVFAPRDDVGELAAAAFVSRAEELGLELAARGRYDAAGGSLEADVKELLGLVPARNPRLAAHLRRGGKRAWQTFVPDVAFSLLYVPDRGERGALVAAYLPYFGVELRTEEIMDPLRLRRKYRGAIPTVVQLVGGAGWNSPSLPARGGAAVQGALVMEVCTALRDDVAAEATAQLATALGHPPSAAAVQGFDAATWMAQALQAGVDGDRERARRALLHARLELGACGPLSLDDRGEVVREPTMLQVDGEDLVLAP
ncbi:MAG: penicillin-binding protein activator [Myxococcales bacterium]|nr:penicillin-binding protein activator [Myxococcales bacterium]